MLSDLRHALRQLRKSPGYTALAVIALALGIGANTAIFSAINTLFLRPLPYTEPAQLVRVWGAFPERGLEQANLSWPRYTAFRDQQKSFTDLAAQSFTGFTLTGNGDAEQVQGARVTQRFFATLGIQPLIGRTFTAEEDLPGGPGVVLLSHSFWQRRFGGRASIVGESIVLNGRPQTVIGILPPTLGFPFVQQQVWAPRPFEQEGITPDLVERGTGFLFVYGRLIPGASRLQAEEQLKVISHRYGVASPEKVDANAGLSVVSFQEDLVGGQRPMFFTLLAAVSCVLLVACANVGNLLLARFTARRKEIAIRTALGAGRGRIVRQFLVESVLTAAIAGLIGVLLSLWGLSALARIGENFIPRANELSLDRNVLAFAVVLSLLTGVVLGIVPAWRASHTDPNESLKDSSRGSTGGRHAGRLRSGLLVAEISLSLVLLVGAALLVQSFRRLQHVDPGFRSEGIVTFNVGLPDSQYPTIVRQTQFFQQLMEKISQLPGVTRTATTSGLPVAAGGSTRSPAAIEGRALPPLNERMIVVRSTISPGFFAALDIPIKQGRDFSPRDRNDTPAVLIINEVMAKRLFPGENPIGRRLITGIQSIPREIVGVAGAVRSQSLTEPPHEEMYYPAAQLDGAFQSVVIRSTRPAASLRSELVAAVHTLDAGIPVAEVQSYTELLEQAIADRRLMMMLLGSFAVLALSLAGMGIYSVIAYGVAQRTNEIGIRMALGAAPGRVVGLILKEGMRLALLGLVIGMAASIALTRLMSRLLYDVSATDPSVLGGVSLFLAAVAALACWFPARRATKVDPMVALRTE